MNVAVSLIICMAVIVIGLLFALFPRWWMRVVSRGARSYMSEDLSSDPTQVMAFRFYGIVAVGLGLYALFQVVQYMTAGT